ncbi:MAG: hypothetical protein ACRETD_07635 [Steroidobacteraceae bacterium]
MALECLEGGGCDLAAPPPAGGEGESDQSPIAHAPQAAFTNRHHFLDVLDGDGPGLH